MPFAVYPKTWCEHLVEVSKDLPEEGLSIPGNCFECGDDAENWVCLTCWEVGCSRYVRGHMKDHSKECGHHMCLSYSDLSVWCFACDSYVHNELLVPAKTAAHLAKFGELPKSAIPRHYELAAPAGDDAVIEEEDEEDEDEEDASGGGGSGSGDEADGGVADPVSKAISADELKKEYFDSPEELEAKVELLAQWMRETEHIMAFTGAGISTSAGIPDYRSGKDTVLETGPGAWERRALEKAGVKVERKAVVKPLLQALPTDTHMALVALHAAGKMGYLASQNVDGLHRRSGFPPEALAELHGNTNLEVCRSCDAEYLRDFYTGRGGTPLSGADAAEVEDDGHATGRRCARCGGMLYDSIVNFGEMLPEVKLMEAFEAAARSRLCLAMGTSLLVRPAASIPEDVSRHADGRLVIINLQKTVMTPRAAMHIHARCDDVMRMLMDKLELDIPPFRLTRRLTVSCSKEAEDTCLVVRGVDVDDTPADYLRAVQLCSAADDHAALPDAAFDMLHDGAWRMSCAAIPSGDFALRLRFYGHYGELPLFLPLRLEGAETAPMAFDMSYDPATCEWRTTDVASGEELIHSA